MYVVVISFFSEPKTHQCDKELTLSSGKFRSPFFPGKYPANYDLKCLAHISTPAGSTVEITFTAFDVERDSVCHFAAVEVRYIIIIK